MGSVGCRHARQLRALGVPVAALRRPGAPRVDGLDSVHEVSDADAFWERDLDAVIVANPTALHVEALGHALAQTNAPVLVEKPLAASAAQAAQIATDQRGRVRVAYCL